MFMIDFLQENIGWLDKYIWKRRNFDLANFGTWALKNVVINEK